MWKPHKKGKYKIKDKLIIIIIIILGPTAHFRSGPANHVSTGKMINQFRDDVRSAHQILQLLFVLQTMIFARNQYIHIYIYIGSTQPRAVHPLPNAKDVYSPPYPLPCLCFSWSPSPGSSMIVAVFLFFFYRAVSTGKSSSANYYILF